MSLTLRLPLLRFWEGERDKEAMLKGLTCPNDIQLAAYVYDTYFAPLMNRKPVPLEEQVETYSACKLCVCGDIFSLQAMCMTRTTLEEQVETLISSSRLSY